MDAAGAWRQPTRPRGRYTRSGTSREDFIVNEERRSRSCAVFALAGGLALIIAGAVIMRRADYGHVKTDLVEAYNKGERRETRKGGSGFHARHPRVRFSPRQQRSDLTTPPPLHPFITAVDAWTTEHSDVFNGTTFEFKFGDTAVPAVFTETAPTVDNAWGKSHRYDPVAFETASLLETVAIPDMQSKGMLPDRLPTLGEIKANVRVPTSAPAGTGGEDGDGDGSKSDAGRDEVDDPANHAPYNATAVLEYLMTPKEFSIVVKREGGEDELVPVGSYPLITRRVSGANGWKVCKFQRAGYYHRGSCTTYEVTSNLCAKVRLTDGSWGLDDTYGGHGCSPRGNWDVPERKRIRAPSQGNPPKLSSVRLLGAGHAVLHDGHDPLFAAMNLTGGSLFFAEKAAESSAMATVMLIVGIAMLVPAAILGYPFVRRSLPFGGARGGSRRYRQGRGIERDHFDEVL